MPDTMITSVNGTSYRSRLKHHRNSRDKHSKWESIPLEIETFDKAEKTPIWKDEGEALWGFLKDNDKFKKLGTEKQQFGYFPAIINLTDDWHGYPVFPFKEKNNKYDISEELLTLWVDEGELTEEEIAILVEGKLL